MAHVPFTLLPASWGLKGKTREIAQAEYERTGYDLEVKILEIKQEDIDSEDYRRKQLEIN